MNEQRGFTLLEILVAFVVMAFSLGIVLQIFSSGVNNAIVAEDYTNAVQIAESLLAEAGPEIPLQTGAKIGTEGEMYHWRMDIFPFETPERRTEENVRPVLMQIDVVVSWGESESYPRSLELKTLKWAVLQ